MQFLHLEQHARLGSKLIVDQLFKQQILLFLPMIFYTNAPGRAGSVSIHEDDTFLWIRNFHL